MAGEITVQRFADADAWAAYQAVVEKETDDALIVKLAVLKEVGCRPCDPSGKPWV
jgi:hypothetical protein